MRPLAIAKICHEAHRALCVESGGTPPPAWDECEPHVHHNALLNVMFHIEKPDGTDAERHDNWFARMKADGWRYGVTRDPVAKTHPHMVPHHVLGDEGRRSGMLFGSICRALLADVR